MKNEKVTDTRGERESESVVRLVQGRQCDMKRLHPGGHPCGSGMID